MLSVQGGATVVGVRFKDGVVLAGERKAAYGTYVMSLRVRKVFLVDKRLAVGFAGLVADVQSILRRLREEINYYRLSVGRDLSVRGTARLLSNILYSFRGMPLETEVLVGGIEKDKPVLVVMDPLGSMVEDDFAAIGSGMSIAIGVLEEGYREDMEEQDAVELAVRSVRMAMKRDALSGGDIDIVVVSSRGASEKRVSV